jgi:hypothetical protein
MIGGHLRKAGGVMLCYSVQDRDSFDDQENGLSITRDQCVLSIEDAEKFAADHGWPYVETSSVTGEGIQEARDDDSFGQSLSVFASLARRDFHCLCDRKPRTLTVVHHHSVSSVEILLCKAFF